MRTQQWLGAFALVTLIVVGAAIGRHFGLTLSEAVYGSALILAVLLTSFYHRTTRNGRG